jgi:hypothetical protein
VPHVERIGTSAAIDAEVETLVSSHSPAVAESTRALRSVVAEAFPDAVETVDFSNKLIAMGRSMKTRDLVFAVIPHTAHVNLQLGDGVDLPDPDGLIEGTGKRIRHVKVRSVEVARSPAVRAIVDAQVAMRR